MGRGQAVKEMAYLTSQKRPVQKTVCPPSQKRYVQEVVGFPSQKRCVSQVLHTHRASGEPRLIFISSFIDKQDLAFILKQFIIL